METEIYEPTEVEQPYRYTNLLPVFPILHYRPLEPFEHVDPGHRAFNHLNPRSFLDAATRTDDLTPNFGTEIHGVNLARLTNDERDQVAVEVARRGLLVFKDQEEFINSGPGFYLEWGRHFGRHCTFVPLLDIPTDILKFTSSIAMQVRHSTSNTMTPLHQVSGTQTVRPISNHQDSQRSSYTGGDTLFTSQVSTFNKLSPTFFAFLKTLKALHSSVELADFSRSGHRGGVVRREPVENIHPVVRRHPVTGEEALYVNKQYTRHIRGLKKEESQNILNFLYKHITASGDCQTRVHWSPNTVVLWDNRITAHSAVVDYGKGLSTERRHGARITPQAERPIPAWDGLELEDAK